MSIQSAVNIKNWSGPALIPQQIVDGKSIPFTLNIAKGCLYKCKYCNSPYLSEHFRSVEPADYYKSVSLREDIAKQLNKDLSFYSYLPQYMKRILVNSESDYYHPEVFDAFNSQKLQLIKDQLKIALNSGTDPDNEEIIKLINSSDRDFMTEVFDVIEKHHKQGNSWLLHIQTKSPKICEHIGRLKQIQDLVQVEISFCTHDEKILERLEIGTPSIKERLEIIKKLSDMGFFVRVLAEPFFGDVDDALLLKEMAFNNGAKAFRHGGLVNLTWDRILGLSEQELMCRTKEDFSKSSLPHFDELRYKSGEKILSPEGKEIVHLLPFPINDCWNKSQDTSENFAQQLLPEIDLGYSTTSLQDWGYIRNVRSNNLQQLAARCEVLLPLEQDIAISACKDPTAEEIIFNFDEKYRSRKDIYEYTYTIGEAVREENVGKPIRILGYIYLLSQPTPTFIKNCVDDNNDRDSIYYYN